jgi:hypothetical protein
MRSNIRALGAGDQEPLISPSTALRVRQELDCLVDVVSASTRIGETAKKERSRANSVDACAANGVLSISPRMYRQYAAQYRELARTATNGAQRAMYLKMATTWIHTAIRFEAGLE